MKKEILSLLLIILALFGVTGCGKKNFGTITDEFGNKTQVTAKEMIEIHRENEKKFESLYYKKNIEVTDEVERVFTSGMVTCLVLKNNWVIAYHERKGPFIDFTSKLDVGDKVHISGSIYDVYGYCGNSDNVVEINITSNSIMEIVK